MSPSYLAYPLKFKPIYKEKVWGGPHLKTLFRRSLPVNKKIGESWEVAWLGENVSVVSNGPYEGRTLQDLVCEFPVEILGKEVAERFPNRFPLLFKLIDAAEPVSLQVHPTDAYTAVSKEGGWGKTEMWHVLWAEPGAEIICGLKEWVNLENFPKMMAEGRVKECLQTYPVKSGDTVFIPAGRVHGTLGSMVFFEIQENSDVTYRLHDWDRPAVGGKKRPLQVQEALENVEFKDEEERLVNPIVSRKDDVEERLLVTCDYFTVEKIRVPIFYEGVCREEKFMVYFIASGRGEIAPLGESEDFMKFKAGDFLFLPASLGHFEIQTDTGCDILKTMVT